MNKGMNSKENASKSLFLESFNPIKGKQKFFKFFGLGAIIAVGYVDPGNWATDLLGGSKYGYLLVSIILIASIMGMFFQYLSIKLGVVTGKDLAQICKDRYRPTVSFILWILAELAIIATDVAEVIGTAIAINLLFGIPLLPSAVITIVSVLLFFVITNKNFRILELFIILLMSIILFSFLYNLLISGTKVGLIFENLIPSAEIFKNKEILFIAVGILGATVMPHNLYLHSSIVNTREFSQDIKTKKQSIRYMNLDSCIALTVAFFINASILILAANTFHFTGYGPVDSIEEAYKLLSPMLGAAAASTIFAIALLAAGENSSITGTMAGQIVMEGFLNIRVKPWLRRLITRLLAITPVVFSILIFGEHSVMFLLILSQVVLSLQLPFALIPLVIFTSSRSLMGELKNGKIVVIISIILSIIVVILNGLLLTSLD